MSIKPMSLKAFGAAVKKIAGDRAYLVQIDSCARLQSDGSGMTVVMYYGWIEGHGSPAVEVGPEPCKLRAR